MSSRPPASLFEQSARAYARRLLARMTDEDWEHPQRNIVELLKAELGFDPPRHIGDKMARQVLVEEMIRSNVRHLVKIRGGLRAERLEEFSALMEDGSTEGTTIEEDNEVIAQVHLIASKPWRPLNFTKAARMLEFGRQLKFPGFDVINLADPPHESFVSFQTEGDEVTITVYAQPYSFGQWSHMDFVVIKKQRSRSITWVLEHHSGTSAAIIWPAYDPDEDTYLYLGEGAPVPDHIRQLRLTLTTHHWVEGVPQPVANQHHYWLQKRVQEIDHLRLLDIRNCLQCSKCIDNFNRYLPPHLVVEADPESHEACLVHRFSPGF